MACLKPAQRLLLLKGTFNLTNEPYGNTYSNLSNMAALQYYEAKADT